MTDKIWPKDISIIKLPFILGFPEKPESKDFEIQVICENGEFVKRSINNEIVIRS